MVSSALVRPNSEDKPEDINMNPMERTQFIKSMYDTMVIMIF